MTYLLLQMIINCPLCELKRWVLAQFDINNPSVCVCAFTVPEMCNHDMVDLYASSNCLIGKATTPTIVS